MLRNILNYTISIVVLFIFAEVQCLGNESLRAHQPIYGLASVIEETLGNSSVCFKELREFRDAVDSKKVWGLKILDASGRPPSGFLYGNNLWIGSHTACLEIPNQKKYEIRYDKVNHTETPFDFPPYGLGFSMAMLRHNSTLQLTMRLPLDWIVQLGLCVPKSCSEQELYNLASNYFSDYPLEFQGEYGVNLQVTRIRMLEEDSLWLLKLPKMIMFMVITTIILMLTIIGTILDVKERNRTKNIIRGHNNGIINGKDLKETGFSGRSVELVNSTVDISNKRDNIYVAILKTFSFYSNVKRWTKTKITDESLGSIYGIRYLAMGWVIIVHTPFFQRDFIQNPPYAWRLAENLPGQIVSNSTYSVDTFFFLSGFLLAYLYFKRSQANGNMNQPVNYVAKCKQFLFMNLNRLLRLTPVYAYIILICDVGFTFYSKKSALFYANQPEVKCDMYWWRNLLYINNLFPRSEMCLGWSWYLSADMQFFVITSLLLILSTEFFSLSACLVILMIIIQIIVTTHKSYVIGYIPTLDDQLEHLDDLYDLPWNRIGPYLIGVITAYILIFKLNNKLVLKKVITKLGRPKIKSRLSRWKPVTVPEMRKFLGIVLYMGLVRYPSIEAYWSTHPIYKNSIVPKIMPRNRFQSLELLEEAEKIFDESEGSEVGEDFDSDDSVRDPDFQDLTSSSSEDSFSEEDHYLLDDVSNDNPGVNPTVTSAWAEVTGNNQQSFMFVGTEGLNPNLDASIFTELNAYFLFVTEDLLETMVMETNRNADQRTKLILWTLFPLLNLWILFTLYKRQVSLEFSAFYTGTSRTLWGVGIGWLVIATSTGNARLLEKILCYKGWIPLSRLTYCAYLLNPLVVTMIALGSEEVLNVSIAGMAISAIGTWMITFLLAFFICTLLESPFILISQMFVKKAAIPSSKTVSQERISQVNQNGTAGNNSTGNNIA